MFTFLGVYCDISIPHSAITFTAIGFTFSAGLVPAEKTLRFLSNDCMKPCDIWLRQLFPVQRINIFIVLTIFPSYKCCIAIRQFLNLFYPYQLILSFCLQELIFCLCK